ncbi:MAG TPA: hypothetical protein VK817_15640 [Trebonia sp.]|nr:hypothetical protein [Trebonia sp.]
MITRTTAPRNAWADPACNDDTADHLMCDVTRAKYMIVSTPVTTVMMACSRMITSNPSAALPTISTVITQNAITFVTSPEFHPSRANTVAVASVARTVSTTSHPTLRIHATIVGRKFPRTPKAARDSTSVGADPRLPASEMNATSRNDTTIPISPAAHACQNEIPNPSTYAP